MKEKLKVGLIVESLEVPRWVRHMMERLAGSRSATLELVVVLDHEGGAEKTPWRHAVARHYAALERWYVEDPQDALQQIGLADHLDRARVLRVRPTSQQGTHHFPAEAVTAIRAEDLDVLFLVRPCRLGGEVLRASRFGVWTCRHGAAHGGAPTLREVLERNPVTASRLEAVVEGVDEGPVFYRSYASTHHWSVTKNCDAIHWKAASFLPRVLEQVWSLGPDALTGNADRVDEPRRSSGGELSNGAAAGLILRAVLRRIQFTVQRWLWREQWLLLRAATVNGPPALSHFQEMLPPGDRDWADPHLLLRDGKHYLFMEEVPFQTSKGHIAVMALDEQGRWSAPTTVLEKPYHLSNPFVFERDGDLYMVPESATNRTVDLYRCERFPDRWVHIRTLLDGLQAVDATLFSHGAKYWMFVNVAENPGASTCDELFLFHTDDPVAGDWTPHPMNPIVSDVRCARPAGAIFVNGGTIVRPAQDCAERYGRAVRFMRIDRLDETGYVETLVGQLRPGRGDRLLGVHTFDRTESLSVIDAIRRLPKFV